MQQALARIEAHDEALGSLLGEAVSTHPMITRRIQALRQWAGTAEYRRLQQRFVGG